jgi:hypothetical protein
VFIAQLLGNVAGKVLIHLNDLQLDFSDFSLCLRDLSYELAAFALKLCFFPWSDLRRLSWTRFISQRDGDPREFGVRARRGSLPNATGPTRWRCRPNLPVIWTIRTSKIRSGASASCSNYAARAVSARKSSSRNAQLLLDQSNSLDLGVLLGPESG